MAAETYDELDRALDAELAKYAAVEPRLGIENRILANLRAKPVRDAVGGWWMWGLAGAGVTLLAFALALGWKLEQPSAPPSATTIAHQSPEMQSQSRPGTELPNRGPIEGPPRAQAPVHPPTHPPTEAEKRRSLSVATFAATPKLDQFPSPLPLSEQEKLLAGYITEQPEHAILLARAQAEALRRDQEEEMRESSAGDGENPQQLSK